MVDLAMFGKMAAILNLVGHHWKLFHWILDMAK